MEDVTKNTPSGTDGTPTPDPAPAADLKPAVDADTVAQKSVSAPKEDSPSKEELNAFRKWQESQKSEAEKQAAAIRKAEKAKEEAESRATATEMKLTAISNGVKSDAVADVIALAKTKVTDKTTVDQAIDEIVKKYPHFLSQSAPMTTGTKTTGNASGVTTEELSNMDYAAYKAYRSGKK